MKTFFSETDKPKSLFIHTLPIVIAVIVPPEAAGFKGIFDHFAMASDELNLKFGQKKLRKQRSLYE
ncbi:hypothetical protein VCHA53O466_50308 [Vibrio chagasii]|nr:hypothetical protein VCHA53O466_50308 [Vibrio chagasii]